VCIEPRLDVTQPELPRTSMTALHRDYLDTGSTEARERVSVLNLNLHDQPPQPRSGR
jgi:hypothetical protein